MKNKDSLDFCCYRIRRKFSLPLPLIQMPELAPDIRAFDSDYPWQIWALWALEERLFSLAFEANAAQNLEAQRLLERDLVALASWPQFNVQNKPDLPFAHAVLVLATANHSWLYLSESCQTRVKMALAKAVEHGITLFGDTIAIQQSSELLSGSKPYQHLHNITLIAMASLAMAAEVIQDKRAEVLSKSVLAHVLARFELTQTGFTEGLSYDGYWLNFTLAWLETQPVNVQQLIINHPAIAGFEQQILAHACPGSLVNSAELGDVEPEQMTFLWSALARLQRFQFSQTGAFLLSQVPQAWLRADAQWILHELQSSICSGIQLSPAAYSSPLVSVSCISLQSGLAHDELNVVVAVSNSPMSHIQKDNGTLVIGKQQRWWITDPGYQQYLKTSEREYTIGNRAHNFPVVNGYAHSYKAPSLISYGKSAKHVNCDFVVLELTDCYHNDANIENVTRTLWRLGSQHILVCDTLITKFSSHTVDYHWHGHADAYWGELSGAVYLAMDDCEELLVIQSSIVELSLSQVQRFRGSRGSMTLCSHSQCDQVKIKRYWWLFSFAASLPRFEANDVVATVNDETFNLYDTVLQSAAEPKLSVLISSEGILARVKIGDEFLAGASDELWHFNLLLDGELIQQTTTHGRSVMFDYFPLNVASKVKIIASYCGVQPLETSYELKPIEIAQIRHKPLVTIATLSDNQFSASCILMPGYIDEDVEYAFYLMVNGERLSVAWYSQDNTVSFDVSAIEAGFELAIRGFVRSKQNETQKFSSISFMSKKGR